MHFMPLRHEFRRFWQALVTSCDYFPVNTCHLFPLVQVAHDMFSLPSGKSFSILHYLGVAKCGGAGVIALGKWRRGDFNGFIFQSWAMEGHYLCHCHSCLTIKRQVLAIDDPCLIHFLNPPKVKHFFHRFFHTSELSIQEQRSLSSWTKKN